MFGEQTFAQLRTGLTPNDGLARGNISFAHPTTVWAYFDISSLFLKLCYWASGTDTKIIQNNSHATRERL